MGRVLFVTLRLDARRRLPLFLHHLPVPRHAPLKQKKPLHAYLYHTRTLQSLVLHAHLHTRTCTCVWCARPQVAARIPLHTRTMFSQVCVCVCVCVCMCVCVCACVCECVCVSVCACVCVLTVLTAGRGTPDGRAAVSTPSPLRAAVPTPSPLRAAVPTPSPLRAGASVWVEQLTVCNSQ